MAGPNVSVIVRFPKTGIARAKLPADANAYL